MNKNILTIVELINCVPSITTMQSKLVTYQDTVCISLLELFEGE